MFDFRSDTVTQPTKAMLEAMQGASVGDDVYGDDPTVNTLETTAAALTGKQAAMFCVSGTQSNLCALLAHCNRGDEVLLGNEYHTYIHEAGGMAVLGGIFPQTIGVQQDGTLAPDELKNAIKPDDQHYAITRLIALENTCNGKVIPPEYFEQIHQLAHQSKLTLHLDGARLFNACTATGVSIRTYAQWCDSLSICLSKGLCAPMGSLLMGDSAFINKARRWRKMLGGGTRQAGYMAAAGLVALTQMPLRLGTDHANAHWLAEELRKAMPVVKSVDYTGSNMLFVALCEQYQQAFFDWMAQQDFLLNQSNPLRLVCHKDVARSACERLVEATSAFCSRYGK